VPTSGQNRHHPFGHDDRVDPDSLAPDDEERAAGPEGPSADIVVRALSVVPFLLLAAFGLIGVISWVLIILFGVGDGDPIWVAAKGLSFGHLVWQLVLAILIGLIPLLVVLGASWATSRGFGADASRTFWTVVQALWGLAGIGLIALRQFRQAWLSDAGFSGFNWWFLFGMVAFAMILAGMRLRRAPRSHTR
jgi:hypothetical protein